MLYRGDDPIQDYSTKNGRVVRFGSKFWRTTALKATGLPGLDLPGIDYCASAQGYGVQAVRIASRDELAAALVRSVASDSPSLIEVPIRAVG